MVELEKVLAQGVWGALRVDAVLAASTQLGLNFGGEMERGETSPCFLPLNILPNLSWLSLSFLSSKRAVFSATGDIGL